MRRVDVLKALGSAFVLGIGLWMLAGSPACAQVGGMGDLKKGVGDAVMKGAAEKAGLPAPEAPTAAPSEDGAAANAPAGEPAAEEPAAADEPDSDTDAAKAAVDDPEVAPGVNAPGH